MFVKTQGLVAYFLQGYAHLILNPTSVKVIHVALIFSLHADGTDVLTLYGLLIENQESIIKSNSQCITFLNVLYLPCVSILYITQHQTTCIYTILHCHLAFKYQLQCYHRSA